MSARMEEMESEAQALQVRLCDEQRQSLLDALTRIPNRLAWEQRIAEELARWQRFRQPTCVLAWDIDGFKAINDKYGHRAGDKVLVVVAESLATGIRGTDFVARYGGEEFVMLLPGTSVANGVAIADQMREVIAQTGFHFRGTPVSVTISCGITELREGDKPEDAFDRADRAMYQAKNSGRNRVVQRLKAGWRGRCGAQRRDWRWQRQYGISTKPPIMPPRCAKCATLALRPEIPRYSSSRPYSVTNSHAGIGMGGKISMSLRCGKARP